MKIDRALSVRPEAPSLDKQDQQLREAAKLYEQHFMREMVKAMRQASPEGGLVEKSMGEKIFSEQLDNQYVENWSHRGGVGLADMIYNHVKERYFPQQQNQLPAPRGPLPFKTNEKGQEASDWKLKPLPLQDSAQRDLGKNDLKMRFESPQGLENSGSLVQAPWAGQVTRSFTSEQGISVVELQHDQGLVSQMVYPGVVEGHRPGDQVAAGDKIGLVQGRGSAPWLQWQVGSG